LEAFSLGIAENQSVQVFEGRVYADGPRRSLAEKAPLNETGGFLWSCNFAIRKALFDALRGFHDAFQHAAMEDVELMYRLRQRGEDVVFLPHAAVCHPWRRLGGWTEILRHQKATFVYLRLHPEERCRINGSVYLKSVLRGFARDIIPALISFRAAGLFEAIVEQIGSLFMVFRLAFGPDLDGSRRIERHGQSDSA
jgi:GT2 family glycosyltransferase